MTMHLTKNFRLEELLASHVAEFLNIDNTHPDDVVKFNLARLCSLILQPLRDHVGLAVYVNSGYRCPALNRQVKGVKLSRHVLGLAADIDCTRFSDDEVSDIYNFLRSLDCVDELIQHLTYIHVSLKDSF